MALIDDIRNRTWFMGQALMIAEKRFRRLKAPRLMRNVYLGTLYMDGMAIEATVEEVAA